ncbi:gliding motility-associated C-terminal domain-containing protein [Winogradskyella sp. SYSU M77433]|uniref:T9SS type B sorting domain-containing protein n=1 Tax=Winogradskyella sp. SYSU M77433 TaxID=3042722 RepID=UPI00248071CD|nr:gliding motility-associated C-terminal domain-containing protein [Winogradskyella sp. SYSU M77433]MDH7913170.1 gliding motility-associated C-terminal domain-containing protein [Winogradskyella sp. SYSU M77433]
MKSFKNYIPFFIILISVGAFISCRDDDNNNQEEEDVFAACCSGLTAFGEDVDNLDQSQGEIVVENLFTPNGDGTNDLFGIENIGLYDNHTVTIYNMNDDVIFESTNYGSNLNEYFP